MRYQKGWLGMSDKNESFGSYLKKLRLESGFGLRRFANLIEIKASNLCDIEHGRRRMPKERLEATADVLGLEKGTSDWEHFFELARTRGELPADVQQMAERRFMPALLRTIDNVKLSDDDVKQLIEEIQGRKIIGDGSS